MDKRNKPTERSSRALKRLEAHLVSPNNEESFRGHVGHISSTEDSPADKNAGSARRRLCVDFPKSAVRGSWKRRTFVTRKRAKFTGAFLLR